MKTLKMQLKNPIFHNFVVAILTLKLSLCHQAIHLMSEYITNLSLNKVCIDRTLIFKKILTNTILTGNGIVGNENMPQAGILSTFYQYFFRG